MTHFAAIIRLCVLALSIGLLAGCEALKPQTTTTAPAEPAPPPSATPQAPSPPTVAPVEKPIEKPVVAFNPLRPAQWSSIPGWRTDPVEQSWSAFVTSCGALRNQPAWQTPCDIALRLKGPSRQQVQQFFEANFTPYQVVNEDGSDQGLITGYYEPLLRGSRTRTATYRHPVFAIPDDLLVLDLSELYPELKNLRLRGRIEGRRVVPYYNRAQIENGHAPIVGKEIVWVDDPVDLFFLQIQGSGRVRLPNGDTVRLGYADQNGHPYRSIGRLLVERGDLPLERASMQGIKAWAKQNPDKLQDLLNYNASYVFFRELPDNLPGPLGALGVPLTARRSLAVDPRYVPLGAPVFLATTVPNTARPLNQLMMAQDTGGAIRGAVRADFFWGFGDEAGAFAGRMRQSGRMWVLLPAGQPAGNTSEATPP